MSEVRAPDQVRDIIQEIERSSYMRTGLDAMKDRADECESMLVAKLIGIGMDPMSHRHFDERLDQWWANNPVPPKGQVKEIVVGAGLHAAIYCAVRARMGAPKPLVVEKSARVGGAFAYSLEPSFYLNSRNRPGGLGSPGRGEALNFIPGAIIQPCDLGGDEYQSNSDLAFVIRATLAMFAKVVTMKEVASYQRSAVRGSNGVKVGLNSGEEFEVDRLIFATGLGQARKIIPATIVNKSFLMDYPNFLARFDKPFPLRGMKRVAVVGKGDSSKTAVEALLGQGPATSMSPGSMDFPERIDWYGLDEREITREDFERCNRSRYKGIGRAFPRERRGQGQRDRGRIIPVIRRPEYYESTYNGIYIDGAFYDAAILCRGFQQNEFILNGVREASTYVVDGRTLAKKLGDREIYYIGPCSALEAESRPNLPSDVAENAVALFRFADRTATLALNFPSAKFNRLTRSQKDKFFTSVSYQYTPIFGFDKASRFAKLKQKIEFEDLSLVR